MNDCRHQSDDFQPDRCWKCGKQMKCPHGRPMFSVNEIRDPGFFERVFIVLIMLPFAFESFLSDRKASRG